MAVDCNRTGCNIFMKICKAFWAKQKTSFKIMPRLDSAVGEGLAPPAFAELKKNRRAVACRRRIRAHRQKRRIHRTKTLRIRLSAVKSEKRTPGGASPSPTF